MSKDPERLRAAWAVAFREIGERLEKGLSVAFATEGDPSLFSTFIYLQREANDRWPGIEVVVVPGVSSIAAVPAVTGIPLADAAGANCHYSGELWCRRSPRDTRGVRHDDLDEDWFRDAEHTGCHRKGRLGRKDRLCFTRNDA